MSYLRLSLVVACLALASCASKKVMKDCSQAPNGLFICDVI